MSKRDLLSFSPDFSSYCVAAIHGTIEHHSLAWNLDKSCNTNFWLSDLPFETELKKQVSIHTCYTYSDPEIELKAWLLLNSGSGGTLFNSKPKPDFLLVLQADGGEQILNEWTELLHHEKAVTLTIVLPTEEIAQLKWLLWLQ